MGQQPNKYHIADDGKVFSVLEDGSVSEIGNVSSLKEHKNVKKSEQPKSRKWMLIAIVSWVVLIAALISLYVQHEAANDYIIYLSNRNFNLEQNLTQAQSELSSKAAELDSINQQILREKHSRIPITITGVQFANEDQYSRTIDDYGSTLYSSNVYFLKPKISYIGKKSGSFILTEKIIRPDGTVFRSDSSPSGATESFRIITSPGRNGQSDLLSWGWTVPGNFEAGRWTFQIWYEDILIFSTTFNIY